jgi:hypothetical protein
MRAIFIRACDRPERLAHLLASLREYEQQHRARRRYVLVDDSMSKPHRRMQRDQLTEFARATGCGVNYFGADESLKWVDGFARSHPRLREPARRLLLREAHPTAQRFGGGRSRNLAMLLSAGSRMALLDDDLRLPLRHPDFTAAGLDPNPDSVPHTRFYANMQDALDSGRDVEQDPFELHLEACGQTLAGCIRQRYGVTRDVLRGLNLGRLELLRPNARIVSTLHGSYGSSRSESTLWLYQMLDPIGREEFWRDRESYARNAQAHFIRYGTARARVHDVPGFTPFTLDNTQLLPCTNPVGRAEDSLGAALTRFCQPDSLALELPVAIGHVQETLRKRFAPTQGAAPPRVNDFLRDFVARQFGTFKSEDPGDRLIMLAHVLRDLARGSVDERIEILREYRRTVHAGIVSRLQNQLESTAAAPVHWQADVRAIVQANAKEMLASAAAPRLAEWSADLDATACANALSEELHLMADACECWPVLWHYAAELGDRNLTG